MSGARLSKQQVAYQRGKAFLAVGKPDLAIESFDEAIGHNTLFRQAYVDRAGAHYALGDPDRAIADYTEAIRLDSAHPDEFYRRGILLEMRGDLQAALADYWDAEKRMPSNDARRQTIGRRIANLEVRLTSQLQLDEATAVDGE